MAAECEVKPERRWNPADGDYSIPTIRGTYGLWERFPAMKKDLVSFEEFCLENFFRDNPDKFWYVYGNIFAKMTRAKPHTGYKRLHDII